MRARGRGVNRSANTRLITLRSCGRSGYSSGAIFERHRAGCREWVERYQGRGRRGFRENTRDEYRRVLTHYVFAHFPERMRLTEVTPSRVATFVGWLCDSAAQGNVLADSTVRNIMAPLRACLATAVREGLVRSNPARDVDLPHRPTAEDSEEEIRAMSREELSTLLALMPGRWRTFFWFLAATGLRVSEAIALQWRHLELDGSSPHVKVRRGIVRGRMGPPKSRHGRRDVPLTLATYVHRLDGDIGEPLAILEPSLASRGELL